ncbi:hypothetical protein GCM10009650_02770 [Nesterenkonia jeotgali]
MASSGEAPLSFYECAPDLWYPERINLDNLITEDDPDQRFGVSLLMSPLEGKYAVRKFSVSYSDDTSNLVPVPRGLTSADLRTLSINALVSQVVEHADFSRARLSETQHELHELPYNPEHLDSNLAEVARIYAREQMAGRRPAKGVVSTMGVPTSTAGYWIRRAKDRGYLRAVLETPREVERYVQEFRGESAET